MEWGLKPVELEIWNGFIFIRFQPGPQGSVAEMLQRFDSEIAPYNIADMERVAGDFIFAEAKVNWKSMRDVDNEGYHVAKAHPSLQDLYGKAYIDEPYINGASRNFEKFNDSPSKLWSAEGLSCTGIPIHPFTRTVECFMALSWHFPKCRDRLYPDSTSFSIRKCLQPKHTL